MKHKLVIIISLISFGLSAQPITDSLLLDQKRTDSLIIERIDNMEDKYISKDESSTKYADIEKRLEIGEKINSQTIESISKQLDAASFCLTLFAVLFGLFGILLGAYVTIIERKVVKINEKNNQLLLMNQKINENVIKINEMIHNDIRGLYLAIKREETVNIIDRLVEVPEDIVNVDKVLLSRDLDKNDFSKLKSAYEKLGDNKKDYELGYKVIFFQHFLYEAMKDVNIRRDLVDFINAAIHGSFENDIVKSTEDFISVIVDEGMHNYNVELNKYFEGLSDSQYKNFTKVYEAIYRSLQSKKNRFGVFTAVQSSPATREAKVNYGNILIDKYYNDNLTESEKLVFEEIDALKEQQSKQ